MGFRHVPAEQLSDEATPFSPVLGRARDVACASSLRRGIPSTNVPLNLLANADKMIE
jgi:hypothetical protein